MNDAARSPKLWLPLAALLAVAGASAVQAQAARDFINIVGSSTVYPFTTTVAEQFGRRGRFKTPKVESTGTGGGIKLFCNGIGAQHPDVVNASRRMKAAELKDCASKGVTEVVEVKVGFDGLTMGQSKKGKAFDLTRQQVYLAVAKQVPNPKNPSELIANPYQRWNQIDPKLPNLKIEVMGPPPTSGTRDSFHELYLEEGCKAFDWIKALEKADSRRFKNICHTIREDGAYIEAGENDNLIVQKLEANPDTVGIFGFSFLEENLDKLRGMKIEGVEPTFESIAEGEFPASRPLFIYAKKAHVGVIPGLQEFLNEYVSERAAGEEGYLTDRGLVPLPEAELTRMRADVRNLKPFKL
jgi:phosphate transport system substrate-binding protein